MCRRHRGRRPHWRPRAPWAGSRCSFNAIRWHLLPDRTRDLLRDRLPLRTRPSSHDHGHLPWSVGAPTQLLDFRHYPPRRLACSDVPSSRKTDAADPPLCITGVCRQLPCGACRHTGRFWPCFQAGRGLRCHSGRRSCGNPIAHGVGFSSQSGRPSAASSTACSLPPAQLHPDSPRGCGGGSSIYYAQAGGKTAS